MTLKNLTQRIFPLVVASCCASLLAPLSLPSQAATIGWNQTAGGTYDYNDTNNWVDGSINGIWDASLTLLGNQTATFGANSVLGSGWDFTYVGNFNVSLVGTGGDRTVTPGGDINVNTASGNRTITVGSDTINQGLNVNLGGTTRTFAIGSGRTLAFVNAISNGDIFTNGGTLSFLGASANAANSDITVKAASAGAGALLFNTTSGTGLTRANSVTLNGSGHAGGALLNVSGNAGANTIESITNALTAIEGFSQVTVTPNAARNARLQAGSFAHDAGATILFRGTDLGVNTLASQTAGAANIEFGVAPTLVGGGGPTGNSTISILKGAYGDTTAGGNGFTATGGLVTYDAARGVRLLSGSEYQSSISDGQVTLDNVRLTNSSGSPAAVTLNSNTTINSLSLVVDAATSALTLGGAGTLTINSGVIYARTTAPAVAGSEITLNSAIDLNGTEGILLFNTNGSSNGTGGALLRINGVIGNDGGNGMTFSSPGGVVEFAGADSNTYTGTTTVNSGGSVRLAKTGTAVSIAGNLVINGGTVQNTGGDISDNSDITINGGSYFQKNLALNSGSGASETFRDLFMTGGSYTDGASGTSSGTTDLRNASLSGGTWSITRGHKTNLSGGLSLTGGTIAISPANDTSRTTIMTLAGPLNISNTAATAYTPLNLLAGDNTNLTGGRLVMNDNLTFTGNSTNSNTVTLNASVATNGGFDAQIWLEGTRTFNIGNGAAAVDLTVNPALVNGTVTGGLIKSGSGTLALNGANTYTGATSVNNGTLLVNGSLSGTTGVSVANGAHLGGAGTIAATIGGAGSIDPGNSPGILTATQVNPAGGLDFNFEFNLVNSLPTWATTENDVLRLTDANPFTQALSGNSTISLYIDANSLQNGDVLFGGIYTDAGDLLPELSNAHILAYLEDENGNIEYMGKNYNLFTQKLFTIGAVANSEFAPGGFLTTFTVAPLPIPEPSTSLLVLCGAVLAGQLRRRNRK